MTTAPNSTPEPRSYDPDYLRAARGCLVATAIIVGSWLLVAALVIGTIRLFQWVL